jgi:hypothetical protein
LHAAPRPGHDGLLLLAIVPLMLRSTSAFTRVFDALW